MVTQKCGFWRKRERCRRVEVAKFPSRRQSDTNSSCRRPHWRAFRSIHNRWLFSEAWNSPNSTWDSTPSAIRTTPERIEACVGRLESSSTLEKLQTIWTCLLSNADRLRDSTFESDAFHEFLASDEPSSELLLLRCPTGPSQCREKARSTSWQLAWTPPARTRLVECNKKSTGIVWSTFSRFSCGGSSQLGRSRANCFGISKRQADCRR